MIIHEAKFIKSSPSFDLCPEPKFPEFAFIGRSNVGKSSLINMLTGRKNLAKTSGTPGKTRLINHFLINEAWYLVDLPGYGFAKTSKKNREAWEKMIYRYLENRQNLVNTFILIDARHEPMTIDLDFISWFGERGLPFVLLFTKADKPTKAKLQHNLKIYREKLLEFWEEPPLSVITSATSKRGREEVFSLIEHLMEED
ncbi:MAG: ribosome biogenesis GTP-binding protein YihA/YsxC [Bacteroidetes bacterium]|nr:ribosome biogenesis GTP-binding protein YihA/YsxC [Bacteroidota bacterium]